MRRLIPLLLLGLASVNLNAALVGEEIDYQAGDTTLKGYLVYDDASDQPRPGVLVVHEWWGHNAYARKRAEMLAEMGYLALAVDMYGDGQTAEHPNDAGKFAGAVKKNLPLMQGRFEAALKLLNEHPMSDAEHTAAIGYCFGGGVVLEMARQGVDLDGVASFHGSLGGISRAKPGKVKAALMVANGADDPFVKPEQIEAFKAEMDAAGVQYSFINYPGAKHSFTNPDATAYGERFNLPLAYNAEADAASWQALGRFLANVFQ